MAKVTYDLGDVVSDTDGQFGVVISPEIVLVMIRNGSGHLPIVRSISGFLPVHKETIAAIMVTVRIPLLAVVIAMGLPNNLSVSFSQNNLRAE